MGVPGRSPVRAVKVICARRVPDLRRWGVMCAQILHAHRDDFRLATAGRTLRICASVQMSRSGTVPPARFHPATPDRTLRQTGINTTSSTQRSHTPSPGGTTVR
jgi:hypothetical protein